MFFCFCFVFNRFFQAQAISLIQSLILYFYICYTKMSCKFFTFFFMSQWQILYFIYAFCLQICLENMQLKHKTKNLLCIDCDVVQAPDSLIHNAYYGVKQLIHHAQDLILSNQKSINSNTQTLSLSGPSRVS